MNYSSKSVKGGIDVHFVNTDKFKTNLFSVFITTPLNRDNVTMDAMLAAVLRRGTQNMPSQEIISKNLEEMYGASFDCGVEKTGDNHVLKFYLECVNDSFLPNNEKIANNALNVLFDIVFNPVLSNGHFLQEYVEGEKENLKQIIESKIDNKAKYALDRCIEEMYKDEPYGLYKFGYVEDLQRIDAKNLYEYYRKLISTAKIDIFISGNMDANIIEEIKENNNIKNIPEHTEKYAIDDKNVQKQQQNQAKIITESMQIAQGKLIIGLDILKIAKDEKYAASVYNIILGGSANSKLFQNVREKASLAYTASSSYLRTKGNILIKSGIEISNYDKAVQIIKEQLEQIKNGEFSNEDVENAKKLIISTINGIADSQDSEITYYFGQELSNDFVSLEDYIKGIEKVNKEQVIKIANQIAINTIYFLKD